MQSLFHVPDGKNGNQSRLKCYQNKFLISKFSIVLFRTARRIYYIFKCGLHYVTMFRRFQRIIFACLTKDFFHAEAISYIAMVKVFLDFPVLFYVYFIKLEVVILQSFLFTFFSYKF